MLVFSCIIKLTDIAAIVSKLRDFTTKNNVKVTAEALNGATNSIEENRRRVARIFQQFATYEDDIDVAMHNLEGIGILRHQPEFNKNNSDSTITIDWD